MKKTTNLPRESGFYYVCPKDRTYWQAIVEISTKDYEDKIYIHCNKVLPLFETYGDVFNEKNFEALIFSDDYAWSEKINLVNI